MSTLYHHPGVDQGASHEQVKAAFRRLARRFIPTSTPATMSPSSASRR